MYVFSKVLVIPTSMGTILGLVQAGATFVWGKDQNIMKIVDMILVIYK